MMCSERCSRDTLEHFLGLPYTIELVPEPEGGWFVSVRELPGCMSQGDTPDEALEMIRDAMRAWIEVALEDGEIVRSSLCAARLSNRKVLDK